MITEDYVNFETAKLLKEKGFNEPCMFLYFAKYKPEGDFKGNFNETKNSEINELSYSAPTLQMAMKWLREVYRLHITIFSSSQESWMFRITKQYQNLEDGIYGEDFYTYEKASDAAIKYCLENLI